MASFRGLCVVLALCIAAHCAHAKNNGGNADQELGRLVRFLRNRGFSTLLAAITQQGLDKAILDALRKGQKLTIFAPNNAVFKVPNCNLNVKNVLLDHVVNGYLDANAVVGAKDWTLLDNLGPNLLFKVKSNPPTIKLRRVDNNKKFVYSRVTRADMFKGSQVVVHRINRVLAAC